MERERKFY